MKALAYLVGAGSMSLGVESAGFELTKVYETPGYSKNAQTWDLNRPDQKHAVLDLDPDSQYFRRYAPDQLDLIFGNPPCGGLSSMTGSKIGSSSNSCMRKWIRMVHHARPKMLLMENANQLTSERVWPLLNDLTKVLDAASYAWWVWKICSFQVGTPQVRRRAFLCATTKTIERPELINLDDLPPRNNPYHCPAGKYLTDLVGVAPASGLVKTREGQLVSQHDYPPLVHEVAKLIPASRDWINSGFNTRKDVERLEPGIVELSESGDEGARERLRKWNYWPEAPKVFSGMQMFRPSGVDFARASGTIIGSYHYVHPIDDRFLTMREMARLMGYPDTWEFHELNPSLIAQGVPANTTRWAADRFLRVVGDR